LSSFFQWKKVSLVCSFFIAAEQILFEDN